ncbi:MAG TPA: ABC transporter substrate-binding protein [Gaiellales bacterium]|nr:ABC transporter substrate-binding protein [Gaiellales bacterium]
MSEARSKRRAVGLVALAVALMLAVPALAAPKMGGTIRMSLADSDVTSFDPIVPFDNMSIWTMLHMYDQLVRAGKDGATIEPGAADSWKTSPDGKTWVLHIRDGITFADGTPLTAEDARVALERAASKDSNFEDNFALIDHATATDPHTLVVLLKKPSASFLAYASLYAASIAPGKALTAQGKAYWEHPIGSGAYILSEWVKNDHVTLKRNAHYWQKPYPYLDELRFDVLTDDNTRMLKFRSGELDIATNVPPNQVEALKRVRGVVVKLFPQMRFDYVYYNHAHKPFGDVRVRQALNLAVDRQALLKSVLFGYGRLAASMLPPMLDWNGTLKPYPYDVAKAKNLLREAGYANGFAAELLVAAGDNQAAQIATILKDEFKGIGVDLKVTVLEPGTIRARRNKGDFDMAKGYYTSDVIDPDELVAFGMDFAGGAVAKWINFKNDRLTQLAAAAEAEMNADKRKAMYFEIQKIAYDQYATIPLYYADNRTALWDYVHDFAQLPTANYHLWETWVSR